VPRHLRKRKEPKMAVNRVPVLKRCRSLDLDPTFLGYDKKSKRTSARAGKKMSEYGLQLREKQKAKFIYGVQEKPFRNMFEKAENMPGLVGTNLMQLLELRLDNVIFRLGYARTRRESRQVVTHKHVTVNGKVINIPSYKVQPGDVIEIKEKSKSLQRFKDIVEANAGIGVPAWLEGDTEKLSGKVLEIPLREQIDVPVNETLIVELYSK
jgi:small subunit ribosomal protein S4